MLCLLASASGLVVSSRTSTISMGLAVGEQMPPSVLRNAGVANKKAVLFFCECMFLIPFVMLMPMPSTHSPLFTLCWLLLDGADDAPSCSKELSSFEEALPSFKA